MEYIKDTKETRITNLGAQQMSTIGFGATLFKKCERLATAIYLVTNFLSDTEPMKARLRLLSLDFVRDASLAKNGSNVLEANVLEALRANTSETLALLELGFVAGLVSEMNFTILKKEYTAVRGTIDIKKASRESRTDTILGDDFFAPPEPSVFASEARQSRVSASIPNSPRNYKGHSIGQDKSVMSDRNPPPSLRGSTLTKQSSVSEPIPHSVQKESRQARILKLIKDNREVMIKDIVKHFPDLSEKTIQRELVSFTESGVLKKMGERRWSRYALV